MLTEINQWIGRFAPFLWMLTSIFAMILNGKAWQLSYRYEQVKGRNIVHSMVRTVAGLLAGLSMAMVVVGALSITTWFAFPELRAHRYAGIPPLLAWQALITTLTLLAVPVVAAAIGYRKLRFLLIDALPPVEASGGVKRAEKKSS